MGLELLHPPLVHFAVAFLFAGAVGEGAGILLGRPTIERFSGTLVLLGTVALVPTVASGFLAGNVVRLPEGSEPLYDRHEKVGLLLLGVFLGLAFWKAWDGGAIRPRVRLAYAAALLFAAALVAYQAWLGGALVYGSGIGVMPAAAAP
jgi:uncharacterized membrane protein